MKTSDCLDVIARIPEGGIVTVLNRLDKLFLLALLDAGRAAWLADTYRKDKNIPAVCYQKFYPEYSSYLQPSKGCYAKFPMPEPVRLDENSDGIRYVGSDDYNGDQTNAFDRTRSRAWLAAYSQHPLMNPSNGLTFNFLYDGSAQILELRGKAQPVKILLVEALFMHPLSIPTFNNDIDDYPITMDGFYAVEKMIFQSDTRIVEATTPKVAFAQSETPALKK